MKDKIRKKYLLIRENLSEKEVEDKSHIIIDKALNLKEYIESKELFIYVSINNEVDTKKLINIAIKDGKSIAVPKIYNHGKMEFYYIKSLNELRKGTFNTFEPTNLTLQATPTKKSLFIIPGVAFDINNNRIGYGGGYYDRYLEKYGNNYTKIALAYKCQITNQLPRENTDIIMDIIITE